MAGRSARRQLARRLRDLREGAFGEKVKQDELAAAFGGRKPLSTAAISTWENGEIDKRPSEARIIQYALVFSTPSSMRPAPHIPRESALDGSTRDRYDELRTELLTLREDAEEEARMEKAGARSALVPADEIWHHDRDVKVFVVASELPIDQRPPFAREKGAFNYSRLARYADLDAFFTMFNSLTKRGYRNLSHRSAGERSIGTARTLVLLGGPAWNPLTRTMLHLLDLPIQQSMQPDGRPDHFLRPDGSPVLPTIIDTGDGGKEIIEDVGLFVRAPNPMNPETDVTICSGIYTPGVLGSALAFTYPGIAHENVQAVREHVGQASAFAALFRVKVVDGRVPTPRLAHEIIDCVPAG